MSVRKYFKFDESDQFLEDQHDINYYMVNQVRRVAVGNMLGDFDENGFYVLDKKVVEQLIAMPKIVVDTVEDVELIRSAIRFDGYLHFMISYEGDRASLILLEKINFESNVSYNAGSYANMNEYVLDEITIPDRDVDKNVVYTRFNIVREDQGKVYDMNNLTPEEQLNFVAIIQKMKYNYLAQNEMLKQETAIEKMEADYFDNILNSFDKYPKEKEHFKLMLKKAILEKINFLQISKPFFQKTINEVLDNCLNVMLLKLTPAQRQDVENKIRKVKQKYYQEYNTIIHLQFISSLNAKQQVSTDNIIGEVINSKQVDVKVTKLEVDEAKLDSSLTSIITENGKLKNDLTVNNSGEKTITAHNPELKQFFNEFKQEIGIDVLKSAPKTYEVKDQSPIKKAPEKKAEATLAPKKVEDVTLAPTPEQKKGASPSETTGKKETPPSAPAKKTTTKKEGGGATRQTDTLIGSYASSFDSAPTQTPNTQKSVNVEDNKTNTAVPTGIENQPNDNSFDPEVGPDGLTF